VRAGREAIDFAQIAAILVIARLCEPSSELHIAEDWYRRTALEDILGVPSVHVHHTRLYQGLDRLLEHKRDLECHLKERLGGLFALDYDLLLYDVTSTYFEGQTCGGAIAKRGYSRDHRPDCRQVCIGLVVTREGFPLAYEVFEGNRVDVTTVEEIVTGMEQRFGRAGRVWVMDRGMTSEANLMWLREGGRRYLVGTPKSELKKWRLEIADDQGWEQVREGLQVKRCPAPEGEEVFLLCRSKDRQEKERAMHERFRCAIREALGRIQTRLERAQRAVERDAILVQIGRILERNQRAAAGFDWRLLEDRARPSGLRLEWKEREEWQEWAQLSEGTYVLRSNVTQWSPDELWRTYVQLWQAEAAFRIHKSELSIRPIWHQKEERVKAHILVCFLSFVLWKTLEGWQQAAGLGNSPRTLLEELARVQCVDVVLPVVAGPKLKLRCVVEPEGALATLLDRLGLRLPKRLRIPAPLAAM
jgi:transposase